MTWEKDTLGDSGYEGNKVLGVRIEDCLTFDVSEVTRFANTLEPTKRNVVSMVGRFFDPLGFLAPVIIRFKIFFQKLCAHGTRRSPKSSLANGKLW